MTSEAHMHVTHLSTAHGMRVQHGIVDGGDKGRDRQVLRDSKQALCARLRHDFDRDLRSM